MTDQELTPSEQPVTASEPIPAPEPPVLDEARVGDIKGALGTIRLDDTGVGGTWRGKLVALLAIMGPGLIVMVGDNDAGGVSTYVQTGQNYGVSLLWVLLLLIPVLIVNQEMVLRLGAVTGVGLGRLTLERFGRRWAAFSIGGLTVFNFLVIITEFIGIGLAFEYLGVSKYVSVPAAAAVLVLITTTGSFQKWERLMFVFVAGNFLVIPLLVYAHPHASPVARAFFTPGVAGGLNSSSALLIVALVGTTIAPWQLYFQQSNVVDKRITTRWINYERVDTIIGSFVVVIAAAALIIVAAFAFAHTQFSGHFKDGGAVAAGLEHTIGRTPGVLFAVVLLNASIIGAGAVTLATSYAFGDFFGMSNSLNRPLREAKSFYGSFAGIVAIAGSVVLIPGAPLGLITIAVQAFGGLLLPSALVFVLLLCNDREVLGPWVNKLWLNALAAVILGVLFILSAILMATTVFPKIDVTLMLVVLFGVLAVALIAVGVARLRSRGHAEPMPVTRRETWRMQPLPLLARPRASRARSATLAAVWVYLAVGIVLLAVKAARLAGG